MNARPTPETDEVQVRQEGLLCGAANLNFARKLERERDEAREWQAMLSGWGGTPEIVNDFIKGQQMRIYAAQEAERERDEARDSAEKAKAYKRVMKEDNAKLRRELDKYKNDADAFVEKWGKSQERAINAERELDELNKRMIEASQRGVDLLIEREDLRKEIAAERALADRLAQFIDLITDALGPYQYLNGTLIVRDAYRTLAAWKEARK